MTTGRVAAPVLFVFALWCLFCTLYLVVTVAGPFRHVISGGSADPPPKRPCLAIGKP